MWAVRSGNPELVRLVLDAGPQLVMRNQHDGETALILACRGRSAECAIQILEKGADPRVRMHLSNVFVGVWPQRARDALQSNDRMPEEDKDMLRERLDAALAQPETFARSAFLHHYDEEKPNAETVIEAMRALLHETCDAGTISWAPEGQGMLEVLELAVRTSHSDRPPGHVLAEHAHDLRGRTLLEIVEDALDKPRQVISDFCAAQTPPLSWNGDGRYYYDELLRAAHAPFPERLPTCAEVAQRLTQTSCPLGAASWTLAEVATALADPSLERSVSTAVLTHALELSRAMVTKQWVRQTARALVAAICSAESIAWVPHGLSFYEALERDAMQTRRTGLKMAERMWATDAGAGVPRLIVPHGRPLAFFHMVNNSVRECQAIYRPEQNTSSTLLCAVRFVRSINRAMVTRGATAATPWPAGPPQHAATPAGTVAHDSTTAHITYRGGEMPGEKTVGF